MSCKWEKKAPTVFFLLSYATFAPCYLIKVVRVDSRSTITVQLPFFSFTALQQTQWWGRPFENAISNVMTTTIAIYKHHSYRNYCNRICHCSRLRKKTRPDTRQSSRGWLGRSSNAKTAQNSKMWRTDRPTDMARCRVACPRLKTP